MPQLSTVIRSDVRQRSAPPGEIRERLPGAPQRRKDGNDLQRAGVRIPRRAVQVERIQKSGDGVAVERGQLVPLAPEQIPVQGQRGASRGSRRDRHSGLVADPDGCHRRGGARPRRDRRAAVHVDLTSVALRRLRRVVVPHSGRQFRARLLLDPEDPDQRK